jgi:hypothetical protein
LLARRLLRQVAVVLLDVAQLQGIQMVGNQVGAHGW